MRRIRRGQEDKVKNGQSPIFHLNSPTDDTAFNTNGMDPMLSGDSFDPDFSTDAASHRPGAGTSSHLCTGSPSVRHFTRGHSMLRSIPGNQIGNIQLQTQHSRIPTPLPTPVPLETFLALQEAGADAISLPVSMPMSTAGSISHAPGAAPDGTILPPAFIRPAYVDLNANRVSPAGPRIHPDPSFRPIGTNNWTDILHDHTLLQYLSNSNIKEIKDHVGTLGEATIDPCTGRRRRHRGGGGPALIAGGPYNTDDATAVWSYCDAYMKRRGQERNNRAARRSRARKESETLHWKTIALAAGAEDRDFEYDAGDPAYGEGLGQGQGLREAGDDVEGGLPRETVGAIRAMWARWNAEWAAAGGEKATEGGPSELTLSRLPPPGFAPGVQQGYAIPEHIADHTLAQIHQQVYGHASTAASMYQSGQTRSHVPLPAQTRAQTRANARRTVTTRRGDLRVSVSPTTAALGLSLPPTSELPASRYQAQHEGSSQDRIKESWEAASGSLL